MSKSHPDSSARLEGGLQTTLPAVSDLPSTAGEVAQGFLEQGTTTERSSGMDDGGWLQNAQQCYRSSTDFFDANLRSTIEESMDLYRSRHPAGSKYNLPSFAKRSRLFRPKTRAAMRKKEAGIAKAFFSTKDIVSCEAPNPADRGQRQAASIQQEILNYRLRKTMDWFQTVIGAFQDAGRQGFCVSRTDWDYRTAKKYYTTTDAFGVQSKSHENVVVRDTPVVILIPGENIRVDQNCDWRDPIGSSNFVIELMPQSVRDVREMMARESLFTFREVTDEMLLSGMNQDSDSIRLKREGSRQDRYAADNTGITDYDTVWIHRNIVRIEGEDYIYLTIGTEHMLTDPMPLSELDPRGYRGYEWGWTVIESHNPFPDGEVQIAKPVQEEINEVANMRADAVKMATIGRYFVKRNSQVDTDALVRFVPGSSIEVSNVQSDVRWDKSPEVGRGAFEEQNLLNTEMDDLLGNFSSGNVQANRQLNETVGGMQLIADNSNEISEFTALTFSETWMQKVLNHAMDLIAIWETDQTIATIVGDRVGVESADVFRALTMPMGVSVNVGFGSTNPESRIRRMQMGFGLLGQVAPALVQSADQAEIAGEVMGALGYPDAARFFPTLGEEEPQVAQLRQQVEQLTGMLEGKQMEFQSREKIAQLTAEARVRVEEIKQAGAERLVQLKNELTFLVERARGEISMIDLRLRFEQNQMKQTELYMQREALSHTIQMAEREFALKVQAMQKAETEKGMEASKQGQQADAMPPGVAALIKGLQDPSSASAASDIATGAPDGLGGGEDMPGVIARGNYGNIPGNEG